jgi:hypothetical protein
MAVRVPCTVQRLQRLVLARTGPVGQDLAGLDGVEPGVQPQLAGIHPLRDTRVGPKVVQLGQQVLLDGGVRALA